MKMETEAMIVKICVIHAMWAYTTWNSRVRLRSCMYQVLDLSIDLFLRENG